MLVNNLGNDEMRWRRNRRALEFRGRPESASIGGDLALRMGSVRGDGWEQRIVQSRPGKSGFPESISARIHPTDQISIAYVYSLNLQASNTSAKANRNDMSETDVNMISGALYHLVATYSVMNPTASCPTNADLARPKSQIYFHRQFSRRDTREEEDAP